MQKEYNLARQHHENSQDLSATRPTSSATRADCDGTGGGSSPYGELMPDDFGCGFAEAPPRCVNEVPHSTRQKNKAFVRPLNY